MKTANIQELISGKGFIMVNKGLAKAVGLTPATIYGELVSTLLYWKDRGQLTIQDGKEWFFCTIEDLEDKTTVKKDVQSKSIKVLEKEGLIESKRFGLPAKRYFHITDKYIEILIGNYISQKPKTDSTNISEQENTDKPLYEQISQKPKTSLRENRKQDFVKTDTNNKALNKKEFNKKDLNNVCSEEAEIISLSESRVDIDDHTQNEIINLLNKVKIKPSFSYSIFKETLNLVDFDIHDLNYFKRALSNNLQKGYVRTAKESAPTGSTAKEILPNWFDDKETKKENNEKNTQSQEQDQVAKAKKEELQRMLDELSNQKKGK